MIIKFTKKYLIYIMLFIPFLKPESLVVSDTATNIFSLWRVISALIVISVYIIKIIPNHPYSLSIIIIQSDLTDVINWVIYDSGIDTQPAVGLPELLWKNIAEPSPGMHSLL